MTEIAFSCGQCGAPLDSEGNYIDLVPEDYNPSAYEHNWCTDCGSRELERGYWFNQQERDT
jgi:DNA-directed RNA polymerase subunit RPC12/RpoP